MAEELTRESFWNVHQPGCVEHLVSHNLRNSPDFIPELTFVALHEDKIVGHIVYSRGLIKDKRGPSHKVITFGPVSVLPSYQKQGVGRALISHSADLARAMGAPGIVIYGDPRYYSRFGFRCAEKYEIKTPDDKYAVALQVLELHPNALCDVSGMFFESEAFEPDMQKFPELDASFPPREKAETDSQHEFRMLVSMRY